MVLYVFARQCVEVRLCAFELEGSCVTAPQGQSRKQAACLKVGQPPPHRTTQQLHLEQHKVGRKSSSLQDGVGKRTTN